MDSNTVKNAEAVKAAMPGFRALHRKKKDKLDGENRKTGQELKKFWVGSAKSSAVLAHNGVVFLVWTALMLLVAYMALEAAFIVIAFVMAETGGILMETSVDVITAYVVIAMCCGFDMFFAFAIEKQVMKAMSRRFWKIDHRTGNIDHGILWHEKHPDAGEA